MQQEWYLRPAGFSTHEEFNVSIHTCVSGYSGGNQGICLAKTPGKTAHILCLHHAWSCRWLSRFRTDSSDIEGCAT